jgi:hypothetical protein
MVDLRVVFHCWGPTASGVCRGRRYDRSSICRAERRSAKGERRSPLQVLINGRPSAVRPYFALTA